MKGSQFLFLDPVCILYKEKEECERLPPHLVQLWFHTWLDRTARPAHSIHFDSVDYPVRRVNEFSGLVVIGEKINFSPQRPQQTSGFSQQTYYSPDEGHVTLNSILIEVKGITACRLFLSNQKYKAFFLGFNKCRQSYWWHQWQTVPTTCTQLIAYIA